MDLLLGQSLLSILMQWWAPPTSTPSPPDTPPPLPPRHRTPALRGAFWGARVTGVTLAPDQWPFYPSRWSSLCASFELDAFELFSCSLCACSRPYGQLPVCPLSSTVNAAVPGVCPRALSPTSFPSLASYLCGGSQGSVGMGDLHIPALPEASPGPRSGLGLPCAGE